MKCFNCKKLKKKPTKAKDRKDNCYYLSKGKNKIWQEHKYEWVCEDCFFIIETLQQIGEELQPYGLKPVWNFERTFTIIIDELGETKIESTENMELNI